MEIVNKIKKWFDDNNLDTAVVGFSGGIDSATTAALMHKAGVKTMIVQALPLEEGGTLSSDYCPRKFASSYEGMEYLITRFELPTMLNVKGSVVSDSFKEAALPILRNAQFYGVAAKLRDDGHDPVVVGTANFDEASYLGFWGKASDGAQDVYPISHLNKSEVYDLAKKLKVPKEIIDAIPSGDLQWSGDLNDYKMIGATYDQIAGVAELARKVVGRNFDKLSPTQRVIQYIGRNVDNPIKFCENVTRNSHKYLLPFPGHHLDPRLEKFRQYAYPLVLGAAQSILNYE